ncbi:MAG: PKD domain-containing protein, partial [Schleiferiaceae bacterium]|nr:PKD domain-containing protein [Schleiferiaceae bacterium]
PVARFTALPDSGCSPLSVNLIDSSSAGVQHQWFVNDSLVSNQASPQLLLRHLSPSQDSLFEIKLVVVAGGTGCSDTAYQNITVFPKPQAGFNLPGSSCPRDSLSPTVSEQGQAPLSYRWTASSPRVGFSDTTVRQPTLYLPDNQSGHDSTIVISQIVTSANGCRDTTRDTLTLYSRPSGQMSLPASACGPLSFVPGNASSAVTPQNFNWTVSPPSGVIISSASDSLPQITLPARNQDSLQYTVQLVSTDARGCSDTVSQNITVYPQPTAGFALSQRQGCTPLSLSLTNQSTPGQSGDSLNTLSYLWNLGPAGTTSATDTLISLSNPGVTDTTYPLQLITTNAYGCQDTLRDSVTVYPAPRALMQVQDSLSCAPFTIDTALVSAQAFPEADSAFAWLWYDAQGNFLRRQNGRHSLDTTLTQDADTVFLRLLAYGLHGCGVDTAAPQLLRTIPDPVARFTLLDTAACTPYSFQVQDSSQNALNYQYYLNGQPVSTQAQPLLNLSNPTFQDSVFTLSLTVSSAAGCIDSTAQEILVYGQTEAVFQAPNTCDGDSVFFSESSLTADSIVAYHWDFGDGTTDSIRQPYHTFGRAGLYPISLGVRDRRGCRDTLRDTITIYSRPKALIKNPLGCGGDSLCKGQSYQLSDSSSVDSLTGSLISWQWDLNEDGMADTSGQSFAYTFTDTGWHKITMEVISQYGCRDTLQRQFYIFDQPQAHFTVDSIPSCGPVNLRVQNSTTGSQVSHSWNLYSLDSNGNRVSMASRTGPQPDSLPALQGSYRKDTTYYLELISQNCCGIDTFSRSFNLRPNPVAKMIVVPDTGCTPLPVTFQLDGQVTGDPDYLLLDYGDGSPVDSLTRSIQLTPSGDTLYIWGQQAHTYTNPLPRDTIYTASLRAINECGDSSVQQNILVHPNNIQGLFTSSRQNGCAPLSVTFEDQSFGATNSAWCFDYDTTANQCNQFSAYGDSVRFTFTQAGTYLVAHFVNDGCSYDTTYTTIQVAPSPLGDFAHNGPVCAGDSLFFSENVTPNGGQITGYEWQFDTLGNSLLQNPSYVFDSAGTYQVCLRVLSANGCPDTICKMVQVYDRPAIAFTFEDACLNQQPISFGDSSQVQSGQIIGRTWKFGDGNTSSSAHPQHSYAQPGTYTVTLILESNFGCTDSLQKTVRILPIPTARFSYQRAAPDSCGAPQTILFQNNSDSAVGYQWDFAAQSNPGVNTSTLQAPSHTYTQPGRYQVRLITQNTYGCSDTLRKWIDIYAIPEAGFTASPRQGCQPHAVTFTDTSVYNYPGGLSKIEWRFGDGQQDTGRQVRHTYPTPGSYDVQLIVTGQGGCQDRDTLQQQIIVRNTPTADFAVQKINARRLRFRNRSQYDDPAIQARWTFGDGDTTYSLDAEHQYRVNLTEGAYEAEVCLLMTNRYGCEDTLCQNFILDQLLLKVPNALAPGQEGVGEASVFLPKGNSLELYELSVYDKWGNRVFFTDSLDENGSPAEAWEGRKNKAGELLPMGAYVWKIRACFSDGMLWPGSQYKKQKGLKFGTVTLIR